MTPEEWAKQFAEDWGMTMETMRDLEARFVAVIEEERERCAAIAEATTRQPMDYIDWSPGPAADDRARIIAQRIRGLMR